MERVPAHSEQMCFHGLARREQARLVRIVRMALVREEKACADPDARGAERQRALGRRAIVNAAAREHGLSIRKIDQGRHDPLE